MFNSLNHVYYTMHGYTLYTIHCIVDTVCHTRSITIRYMKLTDKQIKNKIK